VRHAERPIQIVEGRKQRSLDSVSLGPREQRRLRSLVRHAGEISGFEELPVPLDNLSGLHDHGNRHEPLVEKLGVVAISSGCISISQSLPSLSDGLRRLAGECARPGQS